VKGCASRGGRQPALQDIKTKGRGHTTLGIPQLWKANSVRALVDKVIFPKECVDSGTTMKIELNLKREKVYRLGGYFLWLFLQTSTFGNPVSSFHRSVMPG
jgi:hypothetical protein